MTPREMTAVDPPEVAGVVAHPPLIYLTSILLGAGLHLVWPIRVLPDPAGLPVGGGLVLVGLALFALAIRQFLAAGTPIPTNQPTRAIVAKGPYRFTRNPIYLSMTLVHLGIALWVNDAWLLCTLAVTLLILSWGVIAREERYLARRFGDEYLRYKSSVRRWI